MITFNQIKQLFAFETQGKYCVEILFSVNEITRFDSCWMGKMPDKVTAKDVYWFGLTSDGKNAFDYREILAVADENGGKLKNRVVFYCDEFGTLPKIESAEMMFSASRSRKVSIVPIIQSLAQLEKNYGKEGAEIIVDNTQLTVFGGFAPNSETAQVLSKSLGTRTVMSGSVSQNKNDPSRSLQMIERPLMTADELKSLPKGTFVVTKTGFNPIQVKLKLFFKWGIQFEDTPYIVPLRDNKDICYASKVL